MDGSIRISAVGDVMLGRDVGRHFHAAPEDFEMPEIRALLSDSDVVLANLECPIADGGRADPSQDPHVTFRAAPETISILRGLGVSVVSLGNNHALDYGDEALIETIAHLDRAGIAHAGAGRSYDEANLPSRIPVGDRVVSVVSVSLAYSVNTRMARGRRPGVADHRINRVLRTIHERRASGDVVIVSCHWGYEYRLYPLPYQMRQARQMIDAGASLVLGHGPHYPQGIEQYRGHDIVYSLGNFIFDEPFPLSRRSFVYTVDIDPAGRTVDRRLTPVQLPNHVPQLSRQPAERRMRRLVDLLGAAYPRLDRRVWRELNADYLVELCGRVIRGRSLKYLRVPPASFYLDVGPALARVLDPRRIAGAAATLLRRSTRRPVPSRFHGP